MKKNGDSTPWVALYMKYEATIVSKIESKIWITKLIKTIFYHTMQLLKSMQLLNCIRNIGRLSNSWNRKVLLLSWLKKKYKETYIFIHLENVKIYILIYNLFTFSDLQMDTMPSYFHADKLFIIQLPKQTNKNKPCWEHTDESLQRLLFFSSLRWFQNLQL